MGTIFLTVGKLLSSYIPRNKTTKQRRREREKNGEREEMRDGGRQREREKTALCYEIQTLWISRALITAVNSVRPNRPLLAISR